MWTNFVECAGAVKATSDRDFGLNVLKYLCKDHAVAGLLSYIPADTLVRMHVAEDQRLHVHAIAAPKDAIMFPLGSPNSIPREKGVVTRDMANLESGPYHWAECGKAIAFFYTEEDKTTFARKHTTKLVWLDHIQLFDLVDTSKFTLVAGYPLSEDMVGKLQGTAILPASD